MNRFEDNEKFIEDAMKDFTSGEDIDVICQSTQIAAMLSICRSLAIIADALEGKINVQNPSDDEIKKYLKDRPCEVCVFRKEQGCSKWSCVFEE